MDGLDTLEKLIVRRARYFRRLEKQKLEEDTETKKVTEYLLRKIYQIDDDIDRRVKEITDNILDEPDADDI